MVARFAVLAVIIFSATAVACVPNSAQAADPPPKARVFAPGVITVIPREHEISETFAGPQPYLEIVKGSNAKDWTPNYSPKTETLLEKAQTVTFRRSIWHLEFAFKPLRRVYVDIPHPSGKMQRKLIWYMVYRVKNTGKDWKPVDKDLDLEREAREEYKPRVVDVERGDSNALRFFPQFVFRGSVQEGQNYVTKEYLDRIIPAAMETIAERERVGVQLHNTVEISTIPIELSTEKVDRSVWGVVTWEDIDPRIDYFSLFIQGLTNAYKFKDYPDRFQPTSAPTSARRFAYKTLQMNFWRAGDSILEHEEEIRYGARLDPDPVKQAQILAQYGIAKPLDYLWLYR